MDTQTQIERLIELAIVQRTELKELVAQLPQLREHLNAEVEKAFEETEPQLRSELEEWTTKQAQDKTAALGVALETKIAELAKNLEISTQARYNAIIAERGENARLAAQAEQKIAEHAASLPGAVKEIVTAELARFPRAGEIDQLRKEFAEPRGLNPRGKWQAGEVYNKLDLVTVNGDSFVSNVDGNRERPSRSAANWTLNAARGNSGGGGGITSLNDVLNAPTAGQIVGSENGQYVPKTLVAGANITINETASAITIIGDEGEISLQDGTAAAPSLFFTNDTDTGLYRPAANTLGISVSGTQVAYFDANGLTVPSAGVVAGGSIHAANGNANNPSLSFSGDQDTGFFRHQPNELGITLGGTQYATLTSTTFSITPNLVVSGTGSINGTSIPASKTLVVTTDKLSALASTSSSELAGVISDETGTGSLVFANTPTLVTPNIGAATGTSVNLSGAGTFGGNLTVSGNGLNTFGGTGTTDAAILFGASNVANGAAGYLSISQRANYGYALLGYNMTGTSASDAYTSPKNGTGSAGIELQGGSSGITRFIYSTAATTGGSSLTVTEAARFSSGNLLLKSDGQDSGNGKLQLAAHSTSAGGIGLGTTAVIYNNGSSGIIFGTNGSTTALTLDSSQNATFAGTVTINSYVNLNFGANNCYFTGNPDQAIYFRTALDATSGNQTRNSIDQYFRGKYWNGSASVDVDAVLGVTASTTLANNSLDLGFTTGGGTQTLRIFQDGRATFSGAIAIGNTVQTAAAVASTHKVTISIGGTTYYLLATNV